MSFCQVCGFPAVVEVAVGGGRVYGGYRVVECEEGHQWREEQSLAIVEPAPVASDRGTQARAMKEAGYGTARIAALLGVSPQAIRYHLGAGTDID